MIADSPPAERADEDSDAAVPANPEPRSFLHQIAYFVLPPLTWIPQSSVAQLPTEISAGLVIGVIFVPSVLAYASLLQVPLEVGLWSAVIYAGVYAVVGSCAMHSVGPVAEISLLLLGTPNLPTDPISRAEIFQNIALQVGILSIALCFVTGGTIIRNSFARAVGNAYATAAGIILIVLQGKDAFNVTGSTTILLHESIATLVNGLSNTNWKNSALCFLIFVVEVGYLIGVRYIKRLPIWMPHHLIVVILSTLLVWLARLDTAINLKIVRDVPSRWPIVDQPNFNHFTDTIATVVVITLVSYLQSYSIATRFSDKVNANQEMFASGMCALIAGFFGGFPGSSAFSRSSILADLKVKTPLQSLIASAVVFIVVVGLTRLGVLYYLPKVTLAAVIVSAVVKLVNFEHAFWLLRYFKVDFAVWIVVFFFTLFLGVAWGILSGIALSIVIVLFRVGVPKSTTLAHDTATDQWVDANFDDELLVHPDVHVWAFDSPLYFVNVNYFTDQLEESIRVAKRSIRVVVVQCAGITDIDASSVETFTIQLRSFENRLKMTLLFANMSKRVKEALAKCPDVVVELTHFDSVNAAVYRAERLVVTQLGIRARQRPVPIALFRHSAPTTSENTVAIFAIVAPADRSPKQKFKLPIAGSPLEKLISRVAIGAKGVAMCKDDDSFLYSFVSALENWPRGDTTRHKIAAALARVAQIHRTTLTLQVKGNMLVAKWGGAITEMGTIQAQNCGKMLATRLGLLITPEVVPSGFQWPDWNQTHDVVPRPRVSLRVTNNGDDRAASTGKAFVGGFANASDLNEASILTAVDVESNVIPKGAVTLGGRCVSMVEQALHAKSQRDVDLVLHFPGVRHLVDTLSQMDTTAEAYPLNGLTQVVKLTADLIQAVRQASTIDSFASFRRDIGSSLRAQPDVIRPSVELVFFGHESALDFVRRYTIVLVQLLRRDREAGFSSGGDDDDGSFEEVSIRDLVTTAATGVRFDITKITSLYDNATYDIIHNASQLQATCKYDIRPLVALLQPLYVAVSAGRFGVTSSERLIMGALQGVLVLQRVRERLLQQVDTIRPPEALVPLSHDITERCVEVDFFFTSAAVVTAIRYCIAYSAVLREATGATPRGLLPDDFGWHYMSHLVFHLSRSTARIEAGVDSPRRQTPIPTGYTVELLLSNGAALGSEEALDLVPEHLRDAVIDTQEQSPVLVEMHESSPRVDWNPLVDVDVEDPTEADHQEMAPLRIDCESHELPDLATAKKAAAQLTAVAPMHRVWRMSLIDFSDMVDEMTKISTAWKD